MERDGVCKRATMRPLKRAGTEKKREAEADIGHPPGDQPLTRAGNPQEAGPMLAPYTLL